MVLLEFLTQFDQKFRDIGVDIPTIGTCVFGSEPYLFDTFFDHIADS
jgi:hypothetical protein